MVDDHGNELPATTLQQINQKFDNGSVRMAGIERDHGGTVKELAATRKELHELKQQLADLLEFFTAMKGAIKVFYWVGKLAKPAAAIVGFGAACVTAWSAWRGLR
jgi:hypothetical protein